MRQEHGRINTMISAAENGYLTVEASLIMPIVLYVCIFVIYTGFFMYDRCLMRQDAYRAALMGSSIYRDNNQNVYNTAYDAMSGFVEEKYIAAEYKYEMTVQSTVKVLIEGSIQMPFGGIAEFIGAEKWQIQETGESKCINPVIFIRTCRGLENKFEKQNKNQKKEKENAADRICQ